MHKTSFLFALTAIALLPITPAQAYIGPDAGAGTIAIVLGILSSIFLAFVGIIWYPIKRLIKRRRESRTIVSDPDYSFLDRVLHRLALHYTPIADVSFDLDQASVHADVSDVRSRKHVFVSGLARAGTTLLMRTFHATGRFRSLTHRDMPFVLAPNLWRRMSRVSQRDLARAERAHGDNVLVDADSPESLDEVFWRIFAGNEYLEREQRRRTRPPEELIEKYVRYVSAILAASGLKRRGTVRPVPLEEQQQHPETRRDLIRRSRTR